MHDISAQKCHQTDNGWSVQPCLVRPRGSREDTELKELRRREAAAAASEMESRSLLGLDRFGVAHGCAHNKRGGLMGAPVRK